MRIQQENLGNIPESFWKELKTSPQKILLLDYDGTLAPFKIQRMQARPLPGIIPILKRLSEKKDHTIAIISGRKIEELRVLLKNLPVILIGEHGWVIWEPNQGTKIPPKAKKIRKYLQDLKGKLEDKIPSQRLELKNFSLAVHTRGLKKEKAEQIKKFALRQAKELPAELFAISPFKKGLEIFAQGMDKGKAIKSLLSRFKTPYFAVYLGDDFTDEDAFQVIKNIGYGIKIGKEPRATHAKFYLPNCQSVLKFLRRWEKVVNSF